MKEGSLLKEIISRRETFQKTGNLHPRIHAKNLDRLLGFKISKIEEKLNQKYRPYYMDHDESNRKQHYQGTQTWIGLHPQVLQTPYNDIFECLMTLKDEKIEKIIDIGCGYGRVGLVMNAVFPQAEFTGYEILKKREKEGNRIFDKFEVDNCKIKNQDVLEDDFVLPEAQVYFIYDFSEKEDVNQILEILAKRAKNYKFFLITRGDRVDDLIRKKFKLFWRTHGFISINDLKIYKSK